MRAIRKMITIAAAIAAVSTVGVGSALADPSSTPPLKAVVGVGSDTLTPVFHKLTADYNASHSVELASWDAVNPVTGVAGETIVTKASSSTDMTCAIPRPNGSGAGITALENTATDAGHPCIDFARSSRAPASTDPTTVAFVRLGRDAITWTSPKGITGTPSPAPSTLTIVQIANIYNCTSGFTNWSSVGGKSAPIVPVLPQSGSGTRSTFLLALGQALGLGTGVSLTPGACVVNGTDSSGNPIEENSGVTTGNINEFGTSTAPKVDALYPYSIGAYVAQTGHGLATSIWAPGDLIEHKINGIAPTSGGTGSTEHINTTFPAAMFRILYDVVHNAGTAAAPAIPTSPENLKVVFGTSAQKGWLCEKTGQADLVLYGFLKEVTATPCGSVTDSQLGP